jgi:hypothetical protein
MDIIHRPVVYLNQNVLETCFSLRFQVELTLLGTTDRAGIRLRFGTENSSIFWTQLSKFHFFHLF